MVRLNVDQVELGDYLFSNIRDKLNDKGRTREIRDLAEFEPMRKENEMNMKKAP